MFDIKLKRKPTSYDAHGQPCFPVEQEMGLAETGRDDLNKQAIMDGYAATVAASLNDIVKRHVASASSSGPVDIMDIGGGDGAFFEHVKYNTRTYINIDPGSRPMSGQDLERLGDPRYMCLKCSAEDVPLFDASVDIVISIASLDHIPDYRNALLEANRLLRKGGIFILTLNNRQSWWKKLLSQTTFLKQRLEEIAREHYFQWSFSECRSNLSEFIPVREIHTTTFFPFIPKVWRLMLPVSNFLGRRLLKKYGQNIIAVCQKPGRE